MDELLAPAKVIIKIRLKIPGVFAQVFHTLLETGVSGEKPFFIKSRRLIKMKTSVDYWQPEKQDKRNNQGPIGSST